MKITIPWKTPSINHLYGQHGVRKYLKPEAKRLREEIKKIVNKKIGQEERPEPTKLSVSVKIYENWLCKNGTVKRKDISNREKFLVDSIFDSIGIDDKLIYKHTMEKIQSETEEKAVVVIEEYKND